jgi:hypothetical protein
VNLDRLSGNDSSFSSFGTAVHELCRNRHFHPLGVSFEREADSQIVENVRNQAAADKCS